MKQFGLILTFALGLVACSNKAETLAAPNNPILAALSYATADGFDGLRVGEPGGMTQGRTRYRVRGDVAMVPSFRYCYLIFGPDEHWLYCRRFGNENAEPEFSTLAAFIRATLPDSYQEKQCSDPHFPYWKTWKSASRQAPYVVFHALMGDGGHYVYQFEVHQPSADGVARSDEPC